MNNKANKTSFKKGENHKRWKGNDASYSAIHKWLVRNFGKATKCEKCGKEKDVQWAKLKDKTYIHCRENFIMLCRSCHNYYDEGRNKGKHLSKETKKKLSLANKGQIPWNKTNYFKRCNICHKEFRYVKSDDKLRKYCSRICYHIKQRQK